MNVFYKCLFIVTVQFQSHDDPVNDPTFYKAAISLSSAPPESIKTLFACLSSRGSRHHDVVHVAVSYIFTPHNQVVVVANVAGIRFT